MVSLPARLRSCATRLLGYSESLGSSGQVLVAQYLGLARDNRKGMDAKAPWAGDALEFRDTARSIAKRVLTLSLGLGLTLAACSRAVFPVLLAVVCQSAEVAALVSKVWGWVGLGFVSCECARGGVGRGGGTRRNAPRGTGGG